MQNSVKVRKMTTMAMLAAISVVLVYLVRAPMFLPFLEYDPADIPILIGTFLFGPAAGLLLTVVVSVVQGVTVSAGAGWIGILMHIFATGGFVLVAGNIYHRHKSKKSAAAALLFGSAAMVVMMVIWNLIFTPIYTGMPRDYVAGLIVPAIIPFNVVKSGVNSVVTFLTYKSVSRFVSSRHSGVDKAGKLGYDNKN